ncbi:hypothetical protein QR680_019077 [Steinernema hermaphroditum]|uniref:Uncharacterized protein n=1 Tax=Steinernema hermaphroditum TaxID=289476 RepID=A0AA39LS28_9BILA|nr:hypothetical protein QR680_019077 [Steinernema hermaphroditum]
MLPEAVVCLTVVFSGALLQASIIVCRKSRNALTPKKNTNDASVRKVSNVRENANMPQKAQVDGKRVAEASVQKKPPTSHRKPVVCHEKPMASHRKPVVCHEKPMASHRKAATTHKKPVATHQKSESICSTLSNQETYRGGSRKSKREASTKQRKPKPKELKSPEKRSSKRDSSSKKKKKKSPKTLKRDEESLPNSEDSTERSSVESERMTRGSVLPSSSKSRSVHRSLRNILPPPRPKKVEQKQAEVKKEAPKQVQAQNVVEVKEKPMEKKVISVKEKKIPAEKKEPELNVDVTQKEEAIVTDALKPKVIPMNAKETKIAKGQMRNKHDYPTMADVKSDWDSLYHPPSEKKVTDNEDEVQFQLKSVPKADDNTERKKVEQKPADQAPKQDAPQNPSDKKENPVEKKDLKPNVDPAEDERPKLAELKPHVAPMNAKEAKIAKGQTRNKCDYPTMDDVKSDWNSDYQSQSDMNRANDGNADDKKAEQNPISMKEPEMDQAKKERMKLENILADLKPKVIPLSSKEEKIAKGQMRNKFAYPTMDDVKSDWDSEYRAQSEKKVFDDGDGKEVELQLKSVPQTDENEEAKSAMVQVEPGETKSVLAQPTQNSEKKD